MAWCHQATSHYMSQCWPRSMSPYGITRPQWVKKRYWQYTFREASFSSRSELNYTFKETMGTPLTGTPEASFNIDAGIIVATEKRCDFTISHINHIKWLHSFVIKVILCGIDKSHLTSEVRNCDQLYLNNTSDVPCSSKIYNALNCEVFINGNTVNSLACGRYEVILKRH